MNKLNKNPNITYLETSNQLWSSSNTTSPTYAENEPFSNDLDSGARSSDLESGARSSSSRLVATGAAGFDSSELIMDSSRSSVLSVGVGVSDFNTDT